MEKAAANIREPLMNSGKAVFLARGFDKASVRDICKRIGVTTGAFYNLFSGKEALFTELVQPLIQEFQELYQKIIDMLKEDLGAEEKCEQLLITFVLRHRDEFRLLFDCSRGTAYENFQKRFLEEILCPGLQEVLKVHAGEELGEELVLLLLHMKYQEYRTLMRSEYSQKKVKALVGRMAVFSEAGIRALIEEAKKEKEEEEEA